MDPVFRLGSCHVRTHRDQSRRGLTRGAANAGPGQGSACTRIAPGARGIYQSSGSAIAIHAGAPVVPVAHNAGRCWRRNAFLKYPGMISVSIGQPIDSRGRKAEALTREVETWIESEMQRIDHVQT